MQRKLTESINIAIMENEKSVTDWELHNLAWELYWWVDLFNLAFFEGEKIPMPAISFDKANINNLGHYVIGRNGLGIKENININRAHLNRPLWDVLATLLHELCHSWQSVYGTPSNSWFHNREFQMKLAELGILCNNKGQHLGVTDPFVFILKRHGIAFNQPIQSDGIIKIPPKPKPKGKSKLKKWTCGCTNVRVAVELEAMCLKCGNRFELA